MDNRLERNVNKLLERYKKTSQQIDQIMQQDCSTPLSSQPQGFYQNNANRSRQIRFIDEEESSSRERRRQQSGSIEQISRLKETLNAKELQEREKYESLRVLNKELKMTLKEYIQANKDLEQKALLKDKHIKQLEGEIKILQDQINKVDSQSKEFKVKFDGSEKIVEELQQQNHVLRTKLVGKKQKIGVQKEQMKQQEQQYDDQGQNFGKELERVQRLCEDFSTEIKNQESQNRQLEQEINRLNGELVQKDEQIRYFDSLLQDLRFRDQDSQQQMEYLNQQLQYEKSLFDKKKNKIQEFKNQTEQLQQKNNDLLRLFDQEEKKLQMKDEELVKLQQISNDKYQNALYEIQEANKTIDALQKLKEEYETNTRLDYRNIEQLRDHSQNLQDSLVQVQKYARDLENQIVMQKLDNNKAMDDIEYKIDQLVTTLNISKEENTQYKLRESDYKLKIKQMEDELSKINQKLQKHKSMNENLQLTLKQLEDKFRTYSQQQSIQERQALQVKQDQNITQNKIRVLEDIQSMIKQHKK